MVAAVSSPRGLMLRVDPLTPHVDTQAVSNRKREAGERVFDLMPVAKCKLLENGDIDTYNALQIVQLDDCEKGLRRFYRGGQCR